MHVEYTERRTKYGILFMFSLFYEYSNLEYVHIRVICRVNQAEYVIRLLVAASQEYVNTYSTRRLVSLAGARSNSIQYSPTNVYHRSMFNL